MESTFFRIIADDLGLYPSVNDGIVFLLKEGKIDGASLMANGEAFSDAVGQCLKNQILNIGAHLVLVEERPLTSVVFPKNYKLFFIWYFLGLIKLSDIEKELRAQLEKIVNSGIRPKFINSHQHLHLLPRILDIVVKLAKEYRISYIRIVNEPIKFSGDRFFRKIQLLFLNFLSKSAKKKIKKSGLECNDFFIGFINAGDIREKDVKYAQNLAKKYPNKIIELGCHPGNEDEDLRTKYKNWGGYSWNKELELLKNLTKLQAV